MTRLATDATRPDVPARSGSATGPLSHTEALVVPSAERITLLAESAIILRTAPVLYGSDGTRSRDLRRDRTRGRVNGRGRTTTRGAGIGLARGIPALHAARRRRSVSGRTGVQKASTGVYRTESRPFPPPESGKVAVKVINHYGDEVMKVYQV
jgi:hypothetical protein